ILQKRAVRIIDGASSRCHGIPLFVKYNILTLPSMYVLNCVLYAKNNLDNFATNGDCHDDMTRNRNNLQIRKNKYTVIKNSFHSISIKLLNSLPSVVKHLRVNNFRAQLRFTLTANPLYKLDNFFFILFGEKYSY
ncbi:hypothetical protein C0J52_17615, partial [Blattella germanica]